MNNLFKILFFLLFVYFLTFCTPHNDVVQNEDNIDTSTSVTKSHFNALISNSGTFSLINHYVLNTSSKADSVIITIEPNDTTYPKTITLDFGNGVECFDGVIRKGKIILTLTGPWRLDLVQPNTTLSAEFQNYFFKNPSIYNDFVCRQGNFSITFDSLNQEDMPVYVVDAINAKLIFPDSTYHSWNSSKVLTWNEGYNTPLNAQDDIWTISGSSNGTARNGKSYFTVTEAPLIFKKTCNNGEFVQGILRIVPSGLYDRLIDFGDGDCDNSITVTINGNSFTITN